MIRTAAASTVGASLALAVFGGSKPSKLDGVSLSFTPAQGVWGAIESTPLIELCSLSKATGCRILCKAENLNPGGSVKDRAARNMIAAAEANGDLQPGGLVVEATGGNTGVALAMLCKARGYKCVLAMPSQVSDEKVRLMRLYGAEVMVQPLVPFSDTKNNFFHVAERVARERGGFFVNQFENMNNGEAHFLTTAPEIWEQSGGDVDGFVVAAGTGGTISGCGRFLKSMNRKVQVYLIDCAGSGLFNFIEHGKWQGNPGGTTLEGIGIMRLTDNMKAARPMIDGAFTGTDEEAMQMAYYLIQNEGVYVGPSAALNVVGAVKLAKKMGPGNTIVTVLCDTGDRYVSKAYNEQWLEEKGFGHLVSKQVENLEFVA